MAWTSIPANEKPYGDARRNLKGIVFDAVDLWGMGGKEERLHLTCFCPSCREYFNATQPNLLDSFQDFPNPWNLLLSDSGTGIDYVDSITSSSKEDEIIGWSRQKRFHEVFDDKSPANLRTQAELLRQYIRARHDLTIQSINDVFSQATEGLSSKPQKVLVVEGVNYGWTSGLLLDRLDVPSGDLEQVAYDEVWFDPASFGLYFKHVPFRSYMWTRSRYFIDAFCDFAAAVSDPVRRAVSGVGRLSAAKARAILRTRLNAALGMALTDVTSLAALPDPSSGTSESKRIGFVGVGLDREVGETFIGGISIPEGRIEDNEEEDEGGGVQELMKALSGQKTQDEE